jgi:hypothetical protein
MGVELAAGEHQMSATVRLQPHSGVGFAARLGKTDEVPILGTSDKRDDEYSQFTEPLGYGLRYGVSRFAQHGALFGRREGNRRVQFPVVGEVGNRGVLPTNVFGDRNSL